MQRIEVLKILRGKLKRHQINFVGCYPRTLLPHNHHGIAVMLQGDLQHIRFDTNIFLHMCQALMKNYPGIEISLASGFPKGSRADHSSSGDAHVIELSSLKKLSTPSLVVAFPDSKPADADLIREAHRQLIHSES